MGEFQYDVFLSHSAKDKVVVRPLAERLRADGVKVWFDEWVLLPKATKAARQRKIEQGLEHSRVLVLCMSANAFGSDWAHLESGTFRFRDPLNKERRFLPLRLDGASIKGSLAQFPCINWLPAEREQEYARLLQTCRLPEASVECSVVPIVPSETLSAALGDVMWDVELSSDGTLALSMSGDNTLQLWEVEKRRCMHVLQGHTAEVFCIALSSDGQHALSASEDHMLLLWDLSRGVSCRSLVVHDIVDSVAFNSQGSRFLTGHGDGEVRLWDTRTAECLRILDGHESSVFCVAFAPDDLHAISGSAEGTVIYWDTYVGECLRRLASDSELVLSASFSADGLTAVSGYEDGTLRVWDLNAGDCLWILEGHRNAAFKTSFVGNRGLCLSVSLDRTLRVWNVLTGVCLFALATGANGWTKIAFTADHTRAISGGGDNALLVWDLVAFFGATHEAEAFAARLPRAAPSQVQYTNAKVLLVGDTNAGKTGLTRRLATGEWKPSEGSTVGAWSTQWRLKTGSAEASIDREIWLWDFAGQADQRLIHQLYMDGSALILLLFNADQEDVLPGLRDWQTALRRCVKQEIPLFLVAGRIDTGFKASRGKLQVYAQEQGLAYHETSAKDGTGCDELRAAMINGIPWAQMEKRTSPRIFKLIKDEILKLRDEGQVLHTFKELRELLWRRLPDEPRFTDETLQTVIGLLDGPGAVKELDYGTYILLAPEWINVYAQAVIRTLRSAENDLGVLPLRSIAEGKLIYQSVGRDGAPVEMKRLPSAEERVVLGEMERQLEQRGLCLRQGDKLVFPSHCGRDRPAVLEHPSVFVSYAVKGFLDDIYATLVVKLADSESFQLKELWRDAADFVTLAGDHHMGLKLTRESGSDGDISVYFGRGVTQEEQVIFANYIHTHLQTSCEQAQRLRHYVCPNPKCHAPKGNAEVLMKKLLREKQHADTECDDCGERFPLWDALEKKYASEAVRAQVEQLQADDLAKLDTRRRGKLLALEVGARITSADQKCFEIPATEDEGLDMELEFTNDDGKGTGRRLYLQLKSGNSYLTKRKRDGAEIFAIKKPRWVEYWLQQPHPVMLVIGTFSGQDERAIGKDKLEFADVRWMELSSVLKRESRNGTQPVKQIEFKGERLDLSSVRRWREKIVNAQP